MASTPGGQEVPELQEMRAQINKLQERLSRKVESQKGSHVEQAGRTSAQGSPSAPAHRPPPRSIAFGSAAFHLTHYCPRLKVNTFKVGMHQLRTLDLDNFAINPSKFSHIPEEVLEYFLPQLQVYVLGEVLCSDNEASFVLRTYEVIKRLLRSCPFTAAPVQPEAQPGKQSVQLVQPESDQLEVVEVEQEATSPGFRMQQIAHEEWQRVPGFVKGRIELQIRCLTANKKLYLLGACELARSLNSAAELNAKLQQVAKETLAFAINNAQEGLSTLPVKMLLSDGKWFMRVDFCLKTAYTEGMDLTQLEGDFKYSPAYPLVCDGDVVKEDSYNAVRLLLTWLWDGPWEQLSKASVEKAWQAAEKSDAELVAREAGRYALNEKLAKRQRLS